MKRVLLWVYLLFFVALKVNGQEVEVSSFSYLKSLLGSDSPQIISLSTSTPKNRDTSTRFGLKTVFSWFGFSNEHEQLPSSRIISNGQYGLIGIGLKAINGGNIILDGGKKYGGFKVGLGAFSGRSLNISDLTMERFYPYNNRRGCLIGEMNGGAIFLEGAVLNVSGEVNFTSNEANDGGAIYVKDCLGYSLRRVLPQSSAIKFNNSRVNFTDNKAISDGGAICNYRRSEILFSSSVVNFTNNISDNGGAIYSNEGSKIVFNESEITFNGNINMTRVISIRGDRGGAIFAGIGTTIDCNRSRVNFKYNRGLFGGAVCTWESTINFINSILNFIENESSYGGGIYGVNSEITLNGSMMFNNNRAGSEGGAIYMEGGKLNIETNDGKTTEFRGNRANGKSNAIHFRRGALINFNTGSNGIVDMYDAVTSEEGGGVVNVNGNGEFNLSSTEQSVIPNLNINGRSKFNLGVGTPLEVTGNLTIEQDSVFNIVNGGKNVIYIHLGNYTQNGTLKMDIFGRGGNEEWGESDQIIVNSKVSFGEASKLHIIENEDCSKRTYMLIKYRVLEGRFGEVEIPPEHELEYGYEGKWIALIPKEKRRRLMEARVEEEE
jgi:predicted outer membrane repeat protein